MNAARDSDEPTRWLHYAQDDLRTAVLLLDSDCGIARHVVSQAHQAAEKALKTVLIIESTLVPRTHDLVALRGLQHEPTAESVQDSELNWLTQQATGLRYPGDSIEADRADAERAVAIAHAIVDAVTLRALHS
jgi:HEPN domain-containing protein